MCSSPLLIRPLRQYIFVDIRQTVPCFGTPEIEQLDFLQAHVNRRVARPPNHIEKMVGVEILLAKMVNARHESTAAYGLHEHVEPYEDNRRR